MEDRSPASFIRQKNYSFCGINDNIDSLYKSFCPDIVNSMLIDKTVDNLVPTSRYLSGCYMLIDVSGFTKLSCNLCSKGAGGIDKLRRIINNLFGKIVPIIYEHSGDGKLHIIYI